MGYTHVEFLPLTEHPADCSWGYQASGYFCPTSRYGTARELMEMVDLFHKEGIGVIMDFVPVHFIADTYALNKFDGTALYEYADDDKGYSEWGTCNFNYYRGEVRSFYSPLRISGWRSSTLTASVWMQLVMLFTGRRFFKGN